MSPIVEKTLNLLPKQGCAKNSLVIVVFADQWLCVKLEQQLRFIRSHLEYDENGASCFLPIADRALREKHHCKATDSLLLKTAMSGMPANLHRCRLHATLKPEDPAEKTAPSTTPQPPRRKQKKKH